MTWSIIARDPSTGHIGIAVATRFFAVVARVPYIAAGIGGIATQALVNPYYGIDGVKLLREGRSPREVIDTLTAADDGRENRQLHVMDAGGRIAADSICSYLRDASDTPGSPPGAPSDESVSPITNRLGGAIRHANRVIHREALQRPVYAGMGTTVVATLIRGQVASVAHVGDSRLYLMRGRRLDYD